MSHTDTSPQARTDKWQLTGAGPLQYAPRWPRYLRTPGFWDACSFHGLRLRRLLCISFALETPEGLLPLDPYLSYWHWHRDRIQARHYLVERLGIGYKQQAGVRVFLEETRRIGADATLACDIRFDLLKGYPTAPLHIVAWTLRRLRGGAGGAAKGVDPPGIGVTLFGSRQPYSTQQSFAQRASPLPSLRSTPMWQPLAQHGQLTGGDDFGPAAAEDARFKYMALHWKIQLSEADPWDLSVHCQLTTD